ncbi:hypothetical protein LINPERPRIM_LOCUS36899 [Linum perenne]
MSLFILPKAFTNKMNSMLHNFFWSGDVQKRSIHYTLIFFALRKWKTTSTLEISDLSTELLSQSKPDVFLLSRIPFGSICSKVVTSQTRVSPRPKKGRDLLGFHPVYVRPGIPSLREPSKL